jgi:glutamate/tyrosine decarboxylase-like PLP-dependent enzyme
MSQVIQKQLIIPAAFVVEKVLDWLFNALENCHSTSVSGFLSCGSEALGNGLLTYRRACSKAAHCE